MRPISMTNRPPAKKKRTKGTALARVQRNLGVLSQAAFERKAKLPALPETITPPIHPVHEPEDRVMKPSKREDLITADAGVSSGDEEEQKHRVSRIRTAQLQHLAQPPTPALDSEPQLALISPQEASRLKVLPMSRIYEQLEYMRHKGPQKAGARQLKEIQKGKSHYDTATGFNALMEILGQHEKLQYVYKQKHLDSVVASNLLQTRQVKVPVQTRELAQRLLKEAGTFYDTDTKNMVTYPPCKYGQNCSGHTFRPQGFQNHPQGGFTLMCRMDEREYVHLVRNGVAPSKPRSCLLCYRQLMLIQAVSARNYGNIVRIHPRGNFQVVRNLCDQPKGYQRRYCLLPASDRSFQGFMDPLAIASTQAMHMEYEEETKRWIINEQAMWFHPTVLPEPLAFESVQDFRRRGLAMLENPKALMRETYARHLPEFQTPSEEQQAGPRANLMREHAQIIQWDIKYLGVELSCRTAKHHLSAVLGAPLAADSVVPPDSLGKMFQKIQPQPCQRRSSGKRILVIYRQDPELREAVLSWFRISMLGNWQHVSNERRPLDPKERKFWALEVSDEWINEFVMKVCPSIVLTILRDYMLESFFTLPALSSWASGFYPMGQMRLAVRASIIRFREFIYKHREIEAMKGLPFAEVVEKETQAVLACSYQRTRTPLVNSLRTFNPAHPDFDTSWSVKVCKIALDQLTGKTKPPPRDDYIVENLSYPQKPIYTEAPERDNTKIYSFLRDFLDFNEIQDVVEDEEKRNPMEILRTVEHTLLAQNRLVLEAIDGPPEEDPELARLEEELGNHVISKTSFTTMVQGTLWRNALDKHVPERIQDMVRWFVGKMNPYTPDPWTIWFEAFVHLGCEQDAIQEMRALVYENDVLRVQDKDFTRKATRLYERWPAVFCIFRLATRVWRLRTSIRIHPLHHDYGVTQLREIRRMYPMLPDGLIPQEATFLLVCPHCDRVASLLDGPRRQGNNSAKVPVNGILVNPSVLTSKLGPVPNPNTASLKQVAQKVSLDSMGVGVPVPAADLIQQAQQSAGGRKGLAGTGKMQPIYGCDQVRHDFRKPLGAASTLHYCTRPCCVAMKNQKPLKRINSVGCAIGLGVRLILRCTQPGHAVPMVYHSKRCSYSQDGLVACVCCSSRQATLRFHRLIRESDAWCARQPRVGVAKKLLLSDRCVVCMTQLTQPQNTYFLPGGVLICQPHFTNEIRAKLSTMPNATAEEVVAVCTSDRKRVESIQEERQLQNSKKNMTRNRELMRMSSRQYRSMHYG